MTRAGPHFDAPRMAFIRCLDLRALVDRLQRHCLRPNGRVIRQLLRREVSGYVHFEMGARSTARRGERLNWFEAHEASRDLLVWAFATYRAFAIQEQLER